MITTLQVYMGQKENLVILQEMVYQAFQVSPDFKVHVDSKDRRVNLVHVEDQV
jgi:hypothetical protein